MSAANETVFNSTPKKYRKPSVISTEIGTVIPATDATLKGSNIMVTRITATIAIRNSSIKLLTESSTYLGNSDIFATLISLGHCFWNIANALSTSFPNSTTLLPGCISSDNKMVFIPFCLI